MLWYFTITTLAAGMVYDWGSDLSWSNAPSHSTSMAQQVLSPSVEITHWGQRSCHPRQVCRGWRATPFMVVWWVQDRSSVMWTFRTLKGIHFSPIILLMLWGHDLHPGSCSLLSDNWFCLCWFDLWSCQQDVSVLVKALHDFGGRCSLATASIGLLEDRDDSQTFEDHSLEQWCVEDEDTCLLFYTCLENTTLVVIGLQIYTYQVIISV